MINIEYYYSKVLKILQGRAIKKSKIHKTSKIEPGSHIFNSAVGRHSFCGYNCEIAHCDIGSFCSIANNVFIGGAMHSIEYVSTSPAFEVGQNSIKAKYALHQLKPPKRTFIEHDVWIGNGVMIKQGVTVGIGAVIGMGSVVTKDVQPYSIVAGNPAKEIRKRFDHTIIEELLKSKWWEFDDIELKKYAPYFNNPVAFLNKMKQ